MEAVARIQAQLEYAAGWATKAVALGDLNGDGKLDIVVANMGADGGASVSVMLGKGDGTFAAKVDYQPAGGPVAVVLADLNRDGKLDVVTSGVMVGDTVGVMLGKGDGTLATTVSYQTGNDPYSMALGDLNHDGKLDIVTSNSQDQTLSVFFGKGDGAFAARVDYAGGGGPLALGDLNGDGQSDVVLGSGSVVRVLLGTCP